MTRTLSASPTHVTNVDHRPSLDRSWLPVMLARAPDVE
jgi:hypothetical protein